MTGKAGKSKSAVADRVMTALEGLQADAATRAEGRGRHVTSMPTWKETQQHKLENGKRAVPSEIDLLSLIKDWGGRWIRFWLTATWIATGTCSNKARRLGRHPSLPPHPSARLLLP